MSTHAVEAQLLNDTTIGGPAIRVADSSSVQCEGLCRWWQVDVSTFGLVQNTAPGGPAFGRSTPTSTEFTSGPPEVPGLFVQIEWSTNPGRRGTVHTRRAIVDATSRSYTVFASACSVYVVGPPSLLEFQLSSPRPAASSPATAFGYFDVGLLPCDSPRISRGLFTSRFFAPAAGGTSIPVPAGSRVVQVHDSAASAAYTWASGSVGTFGAVVIVGGISIATMVPNATALLTPAGDRDRFVTAVWEIDV